MKWCVITLSKEFQTLSKKLLDLDPTMKSSPKQIDSLTANASNPFINFRNDMPSSAFAEKDNFHNPDHATIKELQNKISKLNDTQSKS